MHWSVSYIGIPFIEKGRDRAGVDCWGLIRLIYQNELGIELPSYVEGYASLAEKAEISGLFEAGRASPVWEMTDSAREFDVLMFRMGRLGAHVGIVAGRKRMIHAPEGLTSCIEDYSGPRHESRLIGIYRHSALSIAA